MTQNPYKSIDEYTKTFPSDVQERLELMRKTIKEVAPDAEEVISYNMPAFKVNGKVIVYFSGYKNHIGFYPFPSGVEEFERITSEYKKSGKGSIQFPHSTPIPVDLVRQIVKFRIAEVNN